MRKKLPVILLSLLLVLFSAASCGKENGDDPGSEINTGGCELITEDTQYVTSVKGTPQEVYKKSYAAIGGEDVMPIGGWWGPYTPTGGNENGQSLPDYVQDKYFDLIKKAGVNLITVAPNTYSANPASVKRAIGLAEKYGLGYFVYDTYIYTGNLSAEEMDQRLSEYMDSPAVVGIHLIDEPPASNFDSYSELFEVYAQTEYAAEKSLYVNLLPNYSSASQLSGSNSQTITYDEYLKQFVEKTSTDFLSYDYYPFNRQNQGVSNMRMYFQNLVSAKNAANAGKIPFWVFVQAGGGWTEEGEPSVPVYPSEGEMLWNINTCLAFGAKSIQYFTLIQPEEFSHTDNGVDYERIGLIGAGGNVNQWYYYAQKANKQIAAVDEVLMNASFQAVITAGSVAANNLSFDGSGKVDHFRELTGVDAGDALVGCFDYKGGTALYVVNNSVTTKQEITLNFSDRYGYDVTQRARTVSVAGNSLTLTMEAGEGVLVVLR